MGLLPVNNGEILIDGKSMESLQARLAKIYRLFHKMYLFLMVLKNIAFGAIDEKVNLDKINKAIKLANLVDFCNELNLV